MRSLIIEAFILEIPLELLRYSPNGRLNFPDSIPICRGMDDYEEECSNCILYKLYRFRCTVPKDNNVRDPVGFWCTYRIGLPQKRNINIPLLPIDKWKESDYEEFLPVLVEMYNPKYCEYFGK